MEFEDYKNLLKHVYQTVPIGLCLLDKDLRYRHINEWLASINGLSVEEHLGRLIGEVIPDVSAQVELLLRHVIETGEPLIDGNVEAETAASPHHKRIFQHSYHPLRSDEGIVVGVSCIVQDITKRKRANEQLRSSEERFRSVVESARDGIILTDGTSQIISWNQAAQTIFGFSGEEALGKPLTMLMPERYRESHLKGLERYAQTGESRLIGQTIELEGLRKDGSEFPLELSLSTWKSAEGQFYCGIIREITKRKQAENALRESEERYRSVVEDQTELICRYLPDATITFVNEAYCRCFGKSRDELVGNRFLPMIPDQDHAKVQEHFASLGSEYQVATHEHRVIMPDGEVRWHSWTNRVILDDNGKVIELQGTGHDITERKQFQDDLERTQFAVEHSSNPIYWVRKDGVISYANEAACRSLGYSRDELVSMSVPQIDPDFPAEIWSTHWQKMRQAKRLTFEGRHKRKDGSIFPVQITTSILDYKSHEFIWAYVTDITERKEAENALRESEDRARTLLNATHDSALLVNPSSGTILALNETAAQYFGKSVGEVIGLGLHDLVQSDLAESRLTKGQEVVRSGKPVYFQDEREGMYFDNTLYPVFDASGEVVQLAVFAQNITERKQAEAKLQESENRLSSALDAVGGGVFDWDIPNDVWTRSDSWYELMGYQRNELESWEAEHGSIIHLDDIDGMEVAFQAHVRCECDRYNYEFRIHHKSGEWRWLLGLGLIVDRAEDGSPLRMVGTDTDITERKLVEEALIEARNQLEERVRARTAELTQSELRQRVLLESTHAVPWEADCTTWQFTYVGPQATKLLGYPLQQWLDIDFWTSHIHTEDREFALEYCLRSAKTKANYDFEYRMITADGRTVWIHDIVNVQSEAGEPKTLRGFMIDITKRKQAEEALRDSRKRLIKAGQVARMGFLDWNLKTNKVVWSKEVYNLYGIDPETPVTVEQTVDLVHPDDREFAEQNLDMAIHGIRGYDIDHRIVRPDGEVIWVHARADLEHDDEGVPISLIGTVVDITDRKKAEKDLRVSEERFRSFTNDVLDRSAVGMFILDSKFSVVWVNSSIETYFGVKREDIVGKDKRTLITEIIQHIFEDAKEFRERVVATYDNNTYTEQFECHILANGRREERWLEHWSQPIATGLYKGGRVEYYADITERKQAEEELRENATRLQLSTDAARIGHWDWDIRTNEVYLSPEWKRQLGYQDHEMPNLFEEWESRLHPNDRKRTLKLVGDYIDGRQENYAIEFRLKHKDGSYRWIYTRAEKQVDDTGKTCHMFGCHMDITERKRAEEELRQNRDDMRVLARRLITAHEDERRRLARELHDVLSQRLTSIGIDSSMLEREIRPVNESCADKLAKLSDRIRETSVDVHQVSRQLHPSILDELGLVKAMQSECYTFQRRSGIAVRFDGPSEYRSFPKNAELALYRIMQECLRNIEKHSRAVSATVGLSANEDNISLTVTDTGTGFDPTQQREEPGLGLASLKERAGILGGSVSIQSEIGRGTTVTALLPAKTRES